MAQIRIRFYQELNDFVAPALRNTEFIHTLNRKASVKDVIESMGVPHPEVALILVNDISVDFTYIVRNGDRIHAHPISSCLANRPIAQLRPNIPYPPKFVIDVNLGRLARYLRLLGFDCLYRNDNSDHSLAILSSTENRILLTRDRNLLQRRIIIHGYFVRATTPKIQVKEIIKQFNLYQLINPFTRCTHCNGKMVETEKKKIEHLLEPLTKKHYNKFLICSTCGQIYWQGSHYTRAKHLIDAFKKTSSP